MDIAGVSMALSQSELSSKVGVAMLSKSLDLNSTLGQGLVEIIDASAMELSVNPTVGSNIDIRI